MRRSVFTAWALALTASSAHAFMPAPSSAPSVISLRPAAATAPSAKRGHAVGCSCGACAPARRVARASGLQLKMAMGGDARVIEEASKLGVDSVSYCNNLDELFPGAVSEEKYIELMSRVVMDVGFNPKTGESPNVPVRL